MSAAPEKVSSAAVAPTAAAGIVGNCFLRRGIQPRVDFQLDLQVSVLVVGAGPTGLGAATRLNQHGIKDWLLIDQVSAGASPVGKFCFRVGDRIITFDDELLSHWLSTWLSTVT